MSGNKGNIGYFGMGAGITIFLYIVIAFFPSLMITLSIVDIMYDWNDDVGYWIEAVEGMHPRFYTPVYEANDEWIPAVISFFALFIGFSIIQLSLIANIRNTWIILAIWYVLSIYPFLKWFEWSGSGSPVPFPGVDWFPWW